MNDHLISTTWTWWAPLYFVWVSFAVTGAWGNNVCVAEEKKRKKAQRYIINRVSYQYLDPEAVFQLLLFVKTQVTSGGILWSCFITLIKWLCTWTIFAQLIYCLLCYAQFFHQRAKRFWQKTQAKLWSHPFYDV